MREKIRPKKLGSTKLISSFGKFYKSGSSSQKGSIVIGDSRKAIKHLVERHPFKNGIFATD